MNTEKKSVTITVNTVDFHVEKQKLSYTEVVQLVFPGAGNNIYVVKFQRNENDKNWEVLAPGHEVMVKEGMKFRVTPTGES